MNSKNFRAPAVPLITHDPFFSVWSFNEELTGDATRHWTGVRKSIFGIIAADGVLYDFMGTAGFNQEYYYHGNHKLKQTSCEIRPMTTVYTFENELFKLTLKFTSPLLLNDLEVLSRPVTYITYNVEAKDKKEHNYRIYFGFSSEMCVNDLTQTVTMHNTPLSAYFSSGTENMLKNSGDDHCIEWGEFHVAAPHYMKTITGIRSFQYELARDYDNITTPVNYRNNEGPRHERSGALYHAESEKIPVYPTYPTIVIFKDFELKGGSFEDHFEVAYNDIKSIQYFGENIDAYWKKNGDDFVDMLYKAVKEYDEIMRRVEEFEDDLLKKASKVSKKYADIVSLAYRQAIAGHKLTYHNGEVQFLSKENYSNGCIGTVDVTYPSIPLFLIYEPELVEGMLNPVFDMIDKGQWFYEFAPHDVGQYPIANGQLYGYSMHHLINLKRKDSITSQMPVEECGNMLLCVAAACFAKKDMAYFIKHEKILKQWADYLVKMGYNPDNQLCTDDFAGHLAHNVNLSAKAICGVGAIAKLYKEIGNDKLADKYRAEAEKLAAEWEENAFDGKCYRLAFDQEGTWSIKYNMVWDKLLNMNLFSDKVYEAELKQYKTKFNEYGIPLDSRADYTKTDWEMWSTRLFDDKEYTNMIVNAMWKFLSESEEHIPFSDYVFTSKPIVRAFWARTVQGGLFINLLNF